MEKTNASICSMPSCWHQKCWQWLMQVQRGAYVPTECEQLSPPLLVAALRDLLLQTSPSHGKSVGGLSAQIALAQLHWSLHRLGPGQGTGGGRMRDAIRSLLPQGNLAPSPISAAYPYFCSGGVWHMKDRKGTASPSVTCFCLFRVFLSAKPVVYSCPLLESSDLPVDHVPAEGARREPEQDVHLQRLKGVPFSVTPWSPAPRFRWLS